MHLGEPEKQQQEILPTAPAKTSSEIAVNTWDQITRPCAHKIWEKNPNYKRWWHFWEAQNVILTFSDSLSRKAGKLGLPHFCLSLWLILEHLRTSLAGTQRSREASGFFIGMQPCSIFLFSKRFDLFTHIIHLLPSQLASSDNLAAIEWLSLPSAFSIFLYSSVW